MRAAAIIVLILAFLGIGKKKDKPLGPLVIGEFNDPNDPNDPESPIQRWQKYVTDTPTVGAGYQRKKNENLFGPNGIIARALRDHYGREATQGERTDYYRAITRVLSNWRLYGTMPWSGTPAVERVSIRNSDGSMTEGTIGASGYPMNDSWLASLAQGQLPARLVGWTRKSNGNPRYLPDASTRAHSGERRYGVLWLPPIEAIAEGENVTSMPEMDWPAEVFEATGNTWGAWVP